MENVDVFPGAHYLTACVEENSCYFHSSYLLDQIQALVLMNSMLVALEQAADVVGP